MAWKKELDTICRDCGKMATYEVFGSRNSPYGKFCSKCADKRVKEMNEDKESYQ